MKPPRLTLNEARARTVLARQGQGLTLALGADWRVSLQPLPLAEAPADWAGAWTLLAEWGGARFAIRLTEAGLLHWAERASAPALQFDALGPELLTLAFEQAWSQLAEVLAPLRRGTPRLQALQPGTAFAGLQHRIGATLELDDGSRRFEAEIATDALGLLLAAGALAQRPARATEPSAALPLALRLELGRSTLTPAELRSLRPGDIVLMHERWFEAVDDGTMRLALATHPVQSTGAAPAAAGDAEGRDRAAWRIALADGRVHLIEPWSLPVTASPEPRSPDAGVALDAVPVRLSFDLGDLVLPLAELRQLAPGQTFDLGRPLAGAVRLRANGALIGSGELVEIDGRLGVALTQLGEPGEGA